MDQEERDLQVDREEEPEAEQEEVDRQVEDSHRMDSTTSPLCMEVEDRDRHHQRLLELLKRWAIRILSIQR